MDNKEYIKYLDAPLYSLYYVDDVYDENIYARINIKWLHGNESEDILEKMLISLDWAKENPMYDFKSILLGLGYTRKKGEYNNEEIYYFLRRMSEVIRTYLQANKK